MNTQQSIHHKKKKQKYENWTWLNSMHCHIHNTKTKSSKLNVHGENFERRKRQSATWKYSRHIRRSSVLEAVNVVERNVKSRAEILASKLHYWIINKYIIRQIYTSLLSADSSLSLSLSLSIKVSTQEPSVNVLCLIINKDVWFRFQCVRTA